MEEGVKDTHQFYRLIVKTSLYRKALFGCAVDKFYKKRSKTDSLCCVR